MLSPIMLTPPRLPFAVRALNAIARPVSGRLAALSLDPEALLALARANTGLEDFGPGVWRHGLRVLSESLEAEADLTPLGRFIARQEIVAFLENRLQIRDWHARHPEIGDERIERPIVIMGMARTGTSILHDLLAEDPANRVPLTWEVERPCPPPELSTRADDPRIEASRAQLARAEQLIPDFKKMHPMGALLPQECVRILGPEFASMSLQTTYRIPRYARWLHREADLSEAYRGHRRFLQLLQWRSPGRWVLKSPCHLWHLEALLAEYPDALIVQTHRDPLQVLSSLTSLTTTLRAMAGRRVVATEIAREWSEMNAAAFDHSVDARESRLVAPERVFDIQFGEFVRDPFEALRRLYTFAGLDWTGAVEARMRAHWQAHPADEHGRHTHRFADTGLVEAEERERVKRYQDYFGVESEPV
ncbi:MAG: sulfotransferase [Myxococcales bacterium]|nr:sulfotransferase [Myxococcales bacterium]